MRKRWVFLSICFIILSCNSENNRDFESYLFKLNCSELENAIIEYQTKIYVENEERISHGDSVYVCVCSKNINDSICRFILSPVTNIADLKFEMPFYICIVNKHPVFFTAYSVHPNYFIKPPFFSMQDKDLAKLAKKFFPKEINDMNTKKKKTYLYEPANMYLTFKYDSLIGKRFQRGACIDHIPVVLDGREVFL